MRAPIDIQQSMCLHALHVSAFVPCMPFMQVGETNHEKRAMKAEKKAARFAIMPVLQAEEDRRYGSALPLSFRCHLQ